MNISSANHFTRSLKRLLPFLLGAAVFILASCNSTSGITGGSSSTETGVPINLTGKVVDKNGGPISGVVVTLVRAGISDTTDAQGKYRIQRNALAKAALAKQAATQSLETVLDSLIFVQGGQYIAAVGIDTLIDSLADLQVVQRDFSGGLLQAPVKIGGVEAVLSGYGIPTSAVARFFYNSVSNNYSGFVYFPASDSVRSYSIYVKVLDTAGHFTGRSATVPFNSLAGDISFPAFNPGNAIPVANAGDDQSIHLNELISLHGTAVDSFGGTVTKLEWDIGGTGVFRATASGDTSFTVTSLSSPRKIPCVLRATDNDTNTDLDTVILSIDPTVADTPVVVLNTGFTTTNPRPTWSWDSGSGGGGNGTFRFKLDDPDLSTGATQTMGLSFTPSSNLAYGNHTLYVQEENSDGNWSAFGSASTVVVNAASQTLAAVGDSGTLLRTTDGGATWTAQSLGAARLNAVSFTDANTGWVAGVDGSIRKTTNGGSTWTTPFTSASPLNSLYFVDANSGWAATENSTVFSTTDGGGTWTQQFGGNQEASNTSSSVFFISANTGWLTAAGRIWKQVNGGWVAENFAQGVPMASIAFVNADTGWVLSRDSLFKTTNGGAHWSKTFSGTSGLNSLNFVDASTGWTVGNSGSIFKSTDGGTTWTVQTSGTGNDLASVYFKDANNGWAVGTGGTILKTTNGGSTWTAQTSSTVRALHSISPIP